MSVFTETRKPYEFLIRWNKDGIIQGAHIAFLDTVLKDGEIINQTQSSVESVAIGEQIGFPLADVLSQLQIDALKQIDVLNAEIVALKAEKDDLAKINEALVSENESLKIPVK